MLNTRRAQADGGYGEPTSREWFGFKSARDAFAQVVRVPTCTCKHTCIHAHVHAVVCVGVDILYCITCHVLCYINYGL